MDYKKISDISRNLSDDDLKLLVEAENVKQLLLYCSWLPNDDTTITITVECSSGQKATARLFDHAALVDPLIHAINYFQDELV